MTHQQHEISLAHHANLVIGTAAGADAVAESIQKAFRIHIHGNPDFMRLPYETLTIDNARELKSLAETRPANAGGLKIFIISANTATVEAQNALLKLFEEPPEYARFFMVIPAAHLLLPTVRSRLSLTEIPMKSGSDASERVPTDALEFLRAAIPDRLETVKSLIDDISKEKRPRQDAIDFLNGIELAVYDRFGPKEGGDKLHAIEAARTYMNDRAPSLKMLLEYVALSI